MLSPFFNLLVKNNGLGGTAGGESAALGFQNSIAAPSPSVVGAHTQFSSDYMAISSLGPVQTGDLVVLFVSNDVESAPADASDAGFTDIVPKTFQNSISSLIAMKEMGSPVDTSIRLDGAVDVFSAIALRNATYDSISSVVTASSSGNTLDPSPVVVSENDSIVLILSALDDDNSTISTVPTGYTLETNGGKNNRGSNGILSRTGVSAGTEDPGALAWQSVDQRLAYTLSFGPAGSDPRNSTALKELIRIRRISDYFRGRTNNGNPGSFNESVDLSSTEVENASRSLLLTVASRWVQSSTPVVNITSTATNYTLLDSDSYSAPAEAGNEYVVEEVELAEITGSTSVTGSMTSSGGQFQATSALGAFTFETSGTGGTILEVVRTYSGQSVITRDISVEAGGILVIIPESDGGSFTTIAVTELTDLLGDIVEASGVQGDDPDRKAFTAEVLQSGTATIQSEILNTSDEFLRLYSISPN